VGHSENNITYSWTYFGRTWKTPSNLPMKRFPPQAELWKEGIAGIPDMPPMSEIT
jgi:hypothetical protein